MSLRSRFNGEEKGISEKICKLAGSKSRVSENILRRLVMKNGYRSTFYIDMIDRLGLYGNRIEWLFDCCQGDYDSLVEAIEALVEANIAQDDIIAAKSENDILEILKSIEWLNY